MMNLGLFRRRPPFLLKRVSAFSLGMTGFMAAAMLAMPWIPYTISVMLATAPEVDLGYVVIVLHQLPFLLACNTGLSLVLEAVGVLAYVERTS